MKNDQQNSNDKTLLGLKKRTPSNKPKGKRILETVNRMIARIQDDKRKCLSIKNFCLLNLKHL